MAGVADLVAAGTVVGEPAAGTTPAAAGTGRLSPVAAAVVAVGTVVTPA
jgi:hypothetical protein